MIVMSGKIRCVVATLIGLSLLLCVFGACAEDDGEKLELTGVVARPRPETAGTHMYGTIIEIIKIEAAEKRSK